jgi:hypothetical protein
MAVPIRPMTHAKRTAVIDEFGEIQAKIDVFKPTRERHAELREQIASWYENEPVARPYIEEGRKYVLQVSACTNERSIFSMAKLFKLLGVETFLKLCKFPLAAVDAGVPKISHSEFLEESQTGPRQIKVVAKASKEKAA